MHRTYNKFLIVIAIAILLSGAYVYFSHDLDAQAASTNQNGSSLVSSNGSSKSPALDSKNAKISEDTAFLTTLTSLNKLKIDTSIFSRQSFMSLRDNTVTLEQVTPGRPNPFAPINSENNSTTNVETQASPVTTNEATEITTNSALLNGTIDSSISGVTSSYFEYGPTEALGTVTPTAKQSLIGTFFTNLTGLKPKTKYYFSAVAKINGALNYGEIVSFTTN
jgi:hypothetical protein